MSPRETLVPEGADTGIRGTKHAVLRVNVLPGDIKNGQSRRLQEAVEELREAGKAPPVPPLAPFLLEAQLEEVVIHLFPETEIDAARNCPSVSTKG